MSGIDQYTVACLNFNDSNIICKDECGNSWSDFGNLQIVDGKFGKALYLNGASYLQCSNADILTFDSEDFTIDFWCYPYDNTNKHPALIGGTQIQANGSSYESFSFYTKHYYWNGKSGIASINYKFSTTQYLVQSSPLPINYWSHIALVKNNETLSYFINGIKQNEVNYPYPINLNHLDIGYDSVDGKEDCHYKGLIDEFRISKGIARWTSDFTPPDYSYIKYTQLYIDENNQVWGYV